MQHQRDENGKRDATSQPPPRRDDEKPGKAGDAGRKTIDHDPPGAAHAGSDARAEEDNNP